METTAIAAREMPKTAILLAAGLGSRLGTATKDLPKCLLQINGKVIIRYIFESLCLAEIQDIIIVTGHASDKLKEYAQVLSNDFPNIRQTFVHNADYATTNNIYSLKMALEICDSSHTVVILESDIWIAPDVAAGFLATDAANSVLTSPYQYWMDGTVLLINSENNNVSKFITKTEIVNYLDDSLHKTVNWYIFSPQFWHEKLSNFLDAYIQSGFANSYYEDVVSVVDKDD